MEMMTTEEQLLTAAGWKCPLCGFTTSNPAKRVIHGWCHIADETGVGTGKKYL